MMGKRELPEETQMIIRDKPRMMSAASRTMPTPIPREEVTLAQSAATDNLLDAELGSQVIAIGVNGVEDMEIYLPLHLVLEDNKLRSKNLSNAEMKSKIQPEDLCFSLLKDMIAHDCDLDGKFLVHCPELRRNITNERNFQTAIHLLVKNRSHLRFMVSHTEPVNFSILANF